MAVLIRNRHGKRFTSKVILETDNLSPSISFPGEAGKELFGLHILKSVGWGGSAGEEDGDTYKINLTRIEAQYLINKWLGYMERYSEKKGE